MAHPSVLEVAPVPAAPHRRSDLTVRLGVSAASGLLLYLAFPPVGLWWLAPPGVALLTLACRGTTVRRGLLLGLVHGLVSFLLLVEWAATIAGPGALVALALLQAAFLGLLGGALVVVARAPLWPLWTAALWVLQEALRSRLPFGGFPWGRLAFSQGESPLLPLAALGGAPLVTDNGQHILDVAGLTITDPLSFESQVNQWPGVVTVGVFARQRAQVCLLGTATGVKTLTY